jgi:hypothetical protein
VAVGIIPSMGQHECSEFGRISDDRLGCAAIEAEVKTVEWGRSSDGQKVEVYSLKSAQVEVRAMSYGARLVSIRTADRVGQMSDIILGYDSLQEYLNDTTHVGGVVGRFGNRIASGTYAIAKRGLALIAEKLVPSPRCHFSGPRRTFY